MKKIEFKHLFRPYLFFAFSINIFAEEARKKFSPDEFIVMLEKASELPLRKNYDPSAAFSSRLKFVASPNDIGAEWGLSAGFSLWVQNQRDFLLMEWFRETSREKRILICGLFVCERFEVGNPFAAAQPVDFWEGAKRFEKTEALERTEEIKYVVSNAPELARKFMIIFKDILPADQLNRFEVTSKASSDDVERTLKLLTSK